MSDLPIAVLTPLFGKEVCRQRVGANRSLSIGFGEPIPHHKKNLPDPYYGEWELGTYSAAWRIVLNNNVLCGSSEIVESIEELDEKLQSIRLAAIVTIDELSEFDVRVSLEGGVAIEFMCASSEQDESFHVFGPGELYVEFRSPGRWRVGNSRGSWA